MNKYQKSINYFKSYYETTDGWKDKNYPYKLDKEYKKNLDTLQELVDNHFSNNKLCDLPIEDCIAIITAYKETENLITQNRVRRCIDGK